MELHSVVSVGLLELKIGLTLRAVTCVGVRAEFL